MRQLGIVCAFSLAALGPLMMKAFKRFPKMKLTFARLALVGVVTLAMGMGCAKVNLPRHPEGIYLPQSSAPDESANLPPADLGEVCNALNDRLKFFPKADLNEYPKLRALIVELNPSLQPRLAIAHHRALARAMSELQELLISNRHKPFADRISKRYANLILKPRAQSHNSWLWMTELKTTVNRVFQLPDRTPCMNAFLNTFFAYYLQEMDPVGEVRPAASTKTAQGDSTQVESASSLPAALPAVRDRQGLGWVAFRRNEAPEKLEPLLVSLESRHKQGELKALVLDLRETGGKAAEFLAQVQKSADQGWGTLPMVIYVDFRTQGYASVLASKWAGLKNVTIVGTDASTYGYARKLCQASGKLVDDLPSVTITLGCEPVSDPVEGILGDVRVSAGSVGLGESEVEARALSFAQSLSSQ